MPEARAIRAGRAFVELFADDSRLARGLRRAEARLRAFGESVRNIGLKLAGLGSAIAVPMASASKVFAGMGDDLAKMSTRTGFTVETLSALSYAAELSGTSIDIVETSIRKMQHTISDATTGAQGAQDVLASLGLTVKDLVKLSPEQQFMLIADQLAKIEDPTNKASASLEIFGRNGTQLLPMLADGAAGIKAFIEQAQRFGLIISTEDAKAAEKFSDILTVMRRVLKQGAANIGSSLVPMLSQAAQRITKIAVFTNNWIKQNKVLIVTIFRVAVHTVAAGIAFIVLGYAITVATKALGILSAVLTIVGAGFRLLNTVLGVFLSPIQLVIAAVIAMGAYLLYTTGAGEKALGSLGKQFDTLREEAVASYNGIADAMAAGDIQLAAKILWNTLKLEWTRGIHFLEKAWLSFRNFFLTVGYDTWYSLLAVVEIVRHSIEIGWIKTTSFLSETWSNFVGWVSKAWHWCGKQLTRLWNWIKKQFDASFDFETANRAAEEYYEQQKAKIEAEAGKKIAEREERIQRATQTHEVKMAGIGGKNFQKDQGLDEEYRRRMAENEAELAKSQKEWQDAIAEARRKREAKKAEGPGAAEEDIFAKLRSGLAGIGDVLQSVKDRTINVVGTFNAAALLGLQGAGVDERIANATERTAKGVETLRQDVRNNRATFK